MAKKKQKTRVVYGVISDPHRASDGEQVVFALRDAAHRTAALRQALQTAATWGQLRTLVAPHSFDEAMSHCNAFYETYEEFCEMSAVEPGSATARQEYEALAVGQRKPIDADPFERGQIRPLLDGDWPHTLEGQTASWMPEQIVSKYASFLAAMGGGAGHVFDPKDRGKIARELRQHGFTVRRDDDVVRAAQYDNG